MATNMGDSLTNIVMVTVVMVSNNQSRDSQDPAQYTDSLANFKQFTRGMDRYFVPIVMAFGLLGNSLSFLVFVTSHLRRQSSSVYLAALAISDTGVLICIFFNWITNHGVMLLHTDGWCQCIVYLTYVWGFLSVWFVVAFTAERYVAVCHPLQRQNLCTTGKAKVVVVLLVVFALLLCQYATWTTGVRVFGNTGVYWCQPLGKFYQLVVIMNTIDTVLTLILPSVAIIVLNTRIIYAVIQVKKIRRRLSVHHCARQTTSGQSSNSNCSTHSASRKYRGPSRLGSQHSERHANSQSSIPNSSQIKVTKMLVIVSSTFLLLNLPNHTIRVYALILNLTNNPMHDNYKAYKISQDFFQYIYYINFSVNFLLYNLCGRNFRHALKHMLSKVLYKMQRLYGVCRTRDTFEQIGMKDDGQFTVAAPSKKAKAPKPSISTSRSSSDQDCNNTACLTVRKMSNRKVCTV